MMKTKSKIKAGETVSLGGKDLGIDEDGYIQDPSPWVEELAG